MKKINLFFDVGSTLHHPLTENWFITPNFFNTLGYIDLDIVLDARTKVTNNFVTLQNYFIVLDFLLRYCI